MEIFIDIHVMEEGFCSSNVLNFYIINNREMKWFKKWIANGIVRSGHRGCFIMINLFVRFYSRYVSFIHSFTNNCIDQTTYTSSSLKKKNLMTFLHLTCVLRIHLLKLFYRKTIQRSNPFLRHFFIQPSIPYNPLHEILYHTFSTRSKVQNNIFSKLLSLIILLKFS